MTTAEGGLITTNDDRLADWLRIYRNQGMRSRYEFEMLGFNFRMTDLAAAIGIVQLAKLDRNTGRRRAVAAGYDTAFEGFPVVTPVVPADRGHVYHQYTLQVGPERDLILADLRAEGVGADVYYPVPVHRQAYIQELGLHAELPVTDRAAAETIALPIFPGLTEDEQATVIDAVRGAAARHLEADTVGQAGS
jgi:dTDP-4-amino-4,6-dideoxygalactose transaminase